jgi:filamentous hemagglutinin family protein
VRRQTREKILIRKQWVVLATLTLSAGSGWGQIATDGSVGARQSLSGVNITIPSGLGQRIRGNLFHSFQVFNVGAGQTVTFQAGAITLETPSMSNIIGRVTGGTASTIQGTVRSTASGVNLYLINPSGFVFGPGALVDVNGSFYASTAHYLRSADGSRFESRGPGVSLTFTTPDGFGFDSGTVAPIAVQGATLRAREGATVGLVGGGLLVGGLSSNSTLQALGGNAVLVAVASPGFVAHDGGTTSLSGFESLADVLVHRNGIVNVNEGAGRTGGGSVFVRGANVWLADSTITGRSTFGNGRLLDIEGTRDVTIDHANVIGVTTGAGNAGRIRLAGNNIAISNAALIDTSCDPGCTTGNGGALTLRANELLLITGTQTPTFVVSNTFGAGRTGEIDVTAGKLVVDGNAYIQGIGSALSLSSGTQGTGDGTAIRIRSGEILLRNGGQVDASTRGLGRGGQLTVENSGAIRIEGNRLDAGIQVTGGVAPSGFFAHAYQSGGAGSIAVSTRTLEIVGGGQVNSSAFSRTVAGSGGSVTIAASESIRIAGTGINDRQSGVTTSTVGPGNAGSIRIAAPSISLVDGGAIQSQSEGAGRTGDIEITGGDLRVFGFRSQVGTDARFEAGTSATAGAIDIRLTGSLSVSTGNSGCQVNCASISSQTLTSARGGAVTIDAARVIVEDGALILTTTERSGPAGSISIRAAEDLVVRGNARISSAAQFPGTTGPAGTIQATAGRHLLVGSGGSITTSTRGAGNAGAVVLRAGDTLLVSGGGRITSESTSSGSGGSIVASARAIEITSEGTLSTSTGGGGDAGNVTIDAAESLRLSANGSIASESSGAGLAGNLDIRSGGPIGMASGGRITTAAAFSDGGNIRVEAPAAFLDGARITTAVGTGQGDGGNMELRIPTFVLRDSVVTANAFGGAGGNIHIATQFLLKSTRSSITASSELGVDGTITLDSPAIDPSGALFPPAPSFLDAGAILAGRCGPRLAGRASSLVILPRPTVEASTGGLRAWLEKNSLSCEAPPSS